LVRFHGLSFLPPLWCCRCHDEPHIHSSIRRAFAPSSSAMRPRPRLCSIFSLLVSLGNLHRRLETKLLNPSLWVGQASLLVDLSLPFWLLREDKRQHTPSSPFSQYLSCGPYLEQSVTDPQRAGPGIAGIFLLPPPVPSPVFWYRGPVRNFSSLSPKTIMVFPNLRRTVHSPFSPLFPSSLFISAHRLDCFFVSKESPLFPPPFESPR